MGPLKLIDNLPENFLIMNGDILTDLDLRKFFNYHLNNKNIFTVATHSRKERIDYGVLKIDKNNELIGFQEKPIYEFNLVVFMQL